MSENPAPLLYMTLDRQIRALLGRATSTSARAISSCLSIKAIRVVRELAVEIGKPQ